jgi:hypothetical protein
MIHFRYISIILAVIVFFMLKDGCRKPCPEVKTETRTDTLITYKPKHDTVIQRIPKLITEIRVDSFTSYEYIDKMGCNDYNVRREYEDSVKFKEGTVTVSNAVYQNRIVSQKIKLSLDSIPVTTITNTITNTIEQKKRNALYFGANTSYRTDTSISVGASLMFVTKKKLALEAVVSLDTRGNKTYGVGIKIKL